MPRPTANGVEPSCAVPLWKALSRERGCWLGHVLIHSETVGLALMWNQSAADAALLKGWGLHFLHELECFPANALHLSHLLILFNEHL